MYDDARWRLLSVCVFVFSPCFGPSFGTNGMGRVQRPFQHCIRFVVDFFRLAASCAGRFGL